MSALTSQTANKQFITNVKKHISVFSTITLLMAVLSPIFTLIPTASATIDAGDHFRITADSNSIDQGADVVITIAAYTTNDVTVKNIANPDTAYLEIVSSTEFAPMTEADISAVGAGIEVIEVGRGEEPWDYTDGTLSGDTDIDDADEEDNVLAFRLADGDAANNTVTITTIDADSFEVFVWTPGGTINEPGDGDYDGQDFQTITVAASSGAADFLSLEEGLLADGVTSEAVNAKVNIPYNLGVFQANEDGGSDTGALTDVSVQLQMAITDKVESPNLLSTGGVHGLSVNDVIQFTNASDLNALYIITEVEDTTHFRVVGTGTFTGFSPIAKWQPQALTPDTPRAMSASPGTITSNTASTILMDTSTDGITADSVVSIAGCTGVYMVDAVVLNTSLSVIGPTACTDRKSVV